MDALYCATVYFLELLFFCSYFFVLVLKTRLISTSRFNNLLHILIEVAVGLPIVDINVVDNNGVVYNVFCLSKTGCCRCDKNIINEFS